MVFIITYMSIPVILLGMAHAQQAGYGQELKTAFLVLEIAAPVLVFYLKCLEHDVTVLQCLKFIVSLPFALIYWMFSLIIRLGRYAKGKIKSSGVTPWGRSEWRKL